MSENPLVSEVDWSYVTTFGRDVMSKLDSAWQEMGLSEDEISRQIRGIQKQVQSVLSSKLNDELALKDEYVSLSESLASEIQELCTETLKTEHLYKEIPEEENVNLMRRLTWLRKEQEALHKIKEERLAIIEPIQETLFQLWRELGQEPDEDFIEVGNEITEQRIESYEAHLVVVKQEKENRTKALKAVCADICSLFQELEFEVTTPLDVEISCYHNNNNNNEEEEEEEEEENNLGLSMDIIQQVSQRARELTDEKISRTERLKQLGSQIQPLWELLQVDTDERHNFFVENTGLGLGVIEKCEMELQRLEQLKVEKLQDLVEEARETIRELWQNMEYGESQKEAFGPYMNCTQFNEELFARHQDYVAELREQNELLQPILDRFTKYIELYNEREEYEKTIQDSSRLLSRKRGALREEELQRKRVTLKLPKLIESLRKDVAEYQDEHGPLLIQGKLCLDVIEEKENDYLERKREEKERKKRQKMRTQSEASKTGTPHKNAKGAPRPGSIRRGAKENSQHNRF
mmetsp:Transcript_3789/g.4442  ORF Transcript_3789/g.4442 Transcript_3789/m.4442 type:complete len:521 (-) Transcript_3789:1145-2707(-)|eukprot:CAMPEP_0204833700 /NCGR_PEP_ID=MMETSP1346-20131115/17518_1 /ASSEMBLY_ACC=CAM_ASM_000771 /TAXON_ID=215587 /ORGANISM="Aplanochytrium stocchinoi, Strain GSBS06" /LENGTH=520 /DNA_ID=CAMNT_0051966417 /DNA_START=95 /DNA_END=1657 /DNA_ORIENTATION=+